MTVNESVQDSNESKSTQKGSSGANCEENVTDIPK